MKTQKSTSRRDKDKTNEKEESIANGGRNLGSRKNSARSINKNKENVITPFNLGAIQAP